MQKGIAVCGNIYVDYIKMIDMFPREGMLTQIREQKQGVGGCVCNTGIALARLDGSVPIKAVGCIGQDDAGRFILGAFAEHGIDTSGIRRIADQPTAFTDVMTAVKNNTRTFFSTSGVNAQFDIADIDYDHLDAARFHIGYALLLAKMDLPDPDYGTRMARALHLAQQRGMKTSLDVVSEEGERFIQVVTPALPYCNDLIVNEIEAGRVAGVDPRDEQGRISRKRLEQICTVLFEKGVNDHVVVHCPEVGCLMDRQGKCYFYDSLRLPEGYIKGTVGAGDSFCAGVLYGLYQGYEPEALLKLATCTAAANLSSADSVRGVGRVEEVLKLADLYGA